MNKLKKACQRAYRLANNDQGVAMVVAIVVGTVIMVFCLTMLLVTYTLFSQTSRKITQYKCKTLAQSYVEVMDAEFAKGPEDSELVKYLGSRILYNFDDDASNDADSWPDSKTGNINEIVLALDNIVPGTIDKKIADGYTISTSLYYVICCPCADCVCGPMEENSACECQCKEKDSPICEAGQAGDESSAAGGSSIEDYYGSYTLTVVISCTRGEADDDGNIVNGVDNQSYSVNRSYELIVNENTIDVDNSSTP